MDHRDDEAAGSRPLEQLLLWTVGHVQATVQRAAMLSQRL